jgi:hypothetical protein
VVGIFRRLPFQSPVHDVRLVEMPIGFAITLWLGRTFLDGRPLPDRPDTLPRLTSRRFSIFVRDPDVETDDAANAQALLVQSVLRGNRLAVNGVPVLRYSAWGLELPELTLNTGTLWCSSSKNPNAVAVPAWEVFRFFYGVSSVLARALLTPWILEPEN